MDKSKGNKSNYVYIEDFDHEDFKDLFIIKLSIKKEKHSGWTTYNILATKKYWQIIAKSA